MTITEWILATIGLTGAFLTLVGLILIMTSRPMPDPEEATDASHSPLNGSDFDTREARIRAEWRGR